MGGREGEEGGREEGQEEGTGSGWCLEKWKKGNQKSLQMSHI